MIKKNTKNSPGRGWTGFALRLGGDEDCVVIGEEKEGEWGRRVLKKSTEEEEEEEEAIDYNTQVFRCGQHPPWIIKSSLVDSDKLILSRSRSRSDQHKP